MANYTAADVKKLREATGSGMMDCKKALEENDGDFDQAIEALRIKGAKDVGKRAGRATANGVVAARDGSMIELNSETDFVAKNPDFVALAEDILGAAISAKTSDLDALKGEKLGDQTVEEAVAALSARIGEKLELRRVVTLEGPTATYLHRRSSDLPPAIGVVVAYTGSDDGRRPRRRDAGRGGAPALHHARGGAGGRPRGRASRRRGHRARGGQAGQDHRPDRRGSDQRLLQGHRAARAGLGRRSTRSRSAPC